MIKKNIPKNVPDKKTKTQIAKENEIKKEAHKTLSETLSVIAEANQQESKFDTPEEKRRVAIQATLLKMKEKNQAMKAKMAAHAQTEETEVSAESVAAESAAAEVKAAEVKVAEVKTAEVAAAPEQISEQDQAENELKE